MKKNVSKRILSAFLAVVMVLLTIPFVANAESTSNTYATNDYTPFLIESLNNQTVYNEQTADLAYAFYRKAKTYVDSNANSVFSSVNDGDFNFSHNGTQVYLESVYIHKPTGFWDSTCGLLIGVFNYTFDNEEKHLMMVMFEGTKGKWDIFTDLSCVAQKIDDDHWYHNGFYEAAHSHYDNLKSCKFNVGDESITLLEYINRMNSSNTEYQMLVTGHSLGAAIANIFTSYFIDELGGQNVQNNTVAYTFATPLTCSDGTAGRTSVNNVFNLINKLDWVPRVGYGATSSNPIGKGSREGIDLVYYAGDPDKKSILSFSMENHSMKNIYCDILSQANDNIYTFDLPFLLYSNFDKNTGEYQKIVFNNGQLIVSGSGVLSGDWSENTLVDWAKVKDSCTSLVFEANCTITEIGDYAFAGMSQLSNVLDLPETVTKIGNYAFFYCGFRGDLIIPDGMKEVGISAFNGCSNLDSINAQTATAMTWGYGAFANSVCQHDLLLPVEDSGTDLAKVFKTYYVKDRFGSYLIDVDDATSGNVVLPGDEIYIGRIEDEKLNVRPYYDFHYLLTTGHTDTSDNIRSMATNSIANVATVDKSGCITILENCQSGTEFTVVVMDNHKGEPDYDVYDSNRFLHFTVGEVDRNICAGGTGAKTRPYLIETNGQLLAVTDRCNDSSNSERQQHFLSAHYRLIANIDCATLGVAWTSIANNQAMPFTGTIDGNGFSIINMTGAGLVGFNQGKIKNLMIDHANITAPAAVANEFCGSSFIVGKNEGTIENCHVINDSRCDVGFTYAVTAPHHYMGGICGANLGTVKQCSVSSVTLYSTTDAAASAGLYVDCVSFVGGIVGSSKGKSRTEDCLSHDVHIHSCTSHRIYDRAASSENTITYSHIRIGGLLGAAEEAANVFRCVSYNITFDWTNHSKYNQRPLNDIGACDHVQQTGWGDGGCCAGKYRLHRSNFIPYNMTSGVVEACFSDKDNGDQTVERLMSDSTLHDAFSKWEFADTVPTLTARYMDDIMVSTMPSKTAYYIGDSLNLYGLIVKDNNDNLVNGYTVSGFNSNKSGSQTLKVSYATGYQEQPFEATFIVNVENIIPETIVIQPKPKQYSINDILHSEDYTAIVYYNNGEKKEYNGGLPEASSEKDISLYFTSSVDDKSISTVLNNSGDNIVPFACHYVLRSSSGEPLPQSKIIKTLVYTECPHTTTTLNAQTNATATEYGYTGDLVCSTCQSIIEEGTIVDMLECTDHNYGAWAKYDDTQHFRVCECGEVEYEDHNWDTGTVTVEPTYTTEGAVFYTCDNCNATATEVIPILEIPENAPYIVVDSKNAVIGNTVTIKISLKDNPGITSMRINVAYDSALLTLAEVKYNTAMGGQSVLPENIEALNGNVVLYWADGFVNYEDDDVFAMLTFNVSDDAVVDTTTTISVTYDAEDIYDADDDNVPFFCEDGVITFINYTPGDISGDGVLNSKDTTRLMRYLAGWDVEINEAALDVNGDGVVNTKDTTRLMRYLAGWDVEIY